MGRRLALDVFGMDFATIDGTPVRDFVHVNDLARAHRLALEYSLSGGESCAVNLGTGEGVSLMQVIRSVEKIARRPVPFRCRTRRPGDPVSLIANNTKAARVLGWEPAQSDLDYIVKTAWKWHTTSSYLNLRLPAMNPPHELLSGYPAPG
jgi:UDP-glucose 4-epimerase